MGGSSVTWATSLSYGGENPKTQRFEQKLLSVKGLKQTAQKLYPNFGKVSQVRSMTRCPVATRAVDQDISGTRPNGRVRCNGSNRRTDGLGLVLTTSLYLCPDRGVAEISPKRLLFYQFA